MILWGRLMRSFSSAVFFDIIIIVFLFIVIPVFYSIYINLMYWHLMNIINNKRVNQCVSLSLYKTVTMIFIFSRRCLQLGLLLV